ncbi:MAG: hypothetical protein OHK0050_16820 [Roseiflexaceae bacterium]
MISLNYALALRQAGLPWRPHERDCFTVPDGDFDGQIFCLNELPAMIEFVYGEPMITFHGSSEWALDHLITSEAVWLPSESQLREHLERLLGAGHWFEFKRTIHGYQCAIEGFTSQSTNAEDTYALMIIHLLQQRTLPLEE